MKMRSAIVFAGILAGTTLAHGQAANRFGVLVQDAYDPNYPTTIVNSKPLGIAKEGTNLSAGYQRVTQNMSTYVSTNTPAYDDVYGTGRWVVWTLTWKSYPGTQMSTYIAQVIQMIRDKNPQVVEIENEPLGNSAPSSFYADSVQDYVLQLRAVTQAVRASTLTTSNGSLVSATKITPGGITYNPSIMMTWGNIYQGNSANLATANAFADEVMGTQMKNWMPTLYADVMAGTGPSISNGSYINYYDIWINAKYLIAALADTTPSNYIDVNYINFHWYNTTVAGPTSNADAYGQTVAYLHNAVNHAGISTETGEYNSYPLSASDGATVTALMNKATAKSMPIMIWFDGDGSGPYAQALHDGDWPSRATDGVGALRVSGCAFLHVISSSTPCTGTH